MYVYLTQRSENILIRVSRIESMEMDPRHRVGKVVVTIAESMRVDGKKG